jgi:hypothetical protein
VPELPFVPELSDTSPELRGISPEERGVVLEALLSETPLESASPLLEVPATGSLGLLSWASAPQAANRASEVATASASPAPFSAVILDILGIVVILVLVFIVHSPRFRTRSRQ